MLLANYLTVGVRQILRNRLHAAITVLGLAVGLASCLLILMHVEDEFSYDRWVPDAERVYRVHTTTDIPGRSPFRTIRSAGLMKGAFVEDYGDAVETAARIFPAQLTVTRGNEPFADNVVFADPAFLDIFPVRMVTGEDGRAALADPTAILLSRTAARKYFGDADPVGRTLTVCCAGSNKVDYRIAGVFEDLPRESHLRVEMLTGIDEELFKAFPNIFNTWTSVNVHTYLKLKPGADIGRIAADNDAFIDRHLGANRDGTKASSVIHQSFMKVGDLRLHSRAQAGDLGDMKPSGDFTQVVTLAIVAALILIIGCINFTNMSLARSTRRAKEVAVRKVLGAGRAQIMGQFLGEAVLLAAMSVLVALVLAELASPWLSGLLGKELDLAYADPGLWMRLLALVLLVGAIGGAYPALYLAGFKPARILKGEKLKEGGGGGLRTALVVLQFAISVGLMTVTAVVFSQTLFVRQAQLGFDRANVLVVRGAGDSAVPVATANAFIQEVRRLPQVREVARSSDVPTDNDENSTGIQAAGRDAPPQGMNYIAAGEGFFELYRIPTLAGRTFQLERGADPLVRPEKEGDPSTGSIVLNESAARRLGFEKPADAVGQTVTFRIFRTGATTGTVIGVVPDVRFRSLKFDVQPTFYFHGEAAFDDLSVRFEGDPSALLREVERLWKQMVPDQPFTAAFVDDLITAQYAEEGRQAAAFAAFSGLAILVACLGLFGLSSFAAERRTKEIGVRKVFGATIFAIVRLLVWQFSRPVLLANLLAWPLAYLFLRDWLDGFDRRIDLSPLYFAAAALAALMVAWATVAGHAVRVARAKPIHALRYE
ncbi:MAG TPA: ABC transporter permease [Azospirillaceae bacterium]|nr:ABC transporter permease [Azospirillaceae bacterium]